jgi:hypothetical protein
MFWGGMLALNGLNTKPTSPSILDRRPTDVIAINSSEDRSITNFWLQYKNQETSLQTSCSSLTIAIASSLQRCFKK